MESDVLELAKHLHELLTLLSISGHDKAEDFSEMTSEMGDLLEKIYVVCEPAEPTTQETP